MEEITEQFRKLETGRSEQGDEENFKGQSSSSVQQVEEIIGYSFKDKKLLEEAYTDPSCTKYGSKTSYERLEYIGDTVLNFLMGTEQFALYPDLSPGELTQLRSANVSTEKLARAAAQHGLYRFLRHDRPLLGAQVSYFTLMLFSIS